MSQPTTTSFIPNTTNIPGLLVFDIVYPKDERGYYQENFQQQKLVQAGLDSKFSIVQTNVSYNKNRGVTRGFHAEPWNKYLSIVKGRVFVVFVDLRQGNTYGETFTTEIDNNKSIYLPQGVANSFQTLEDDTYYLYSVDAHWSTEAYEKYCFVNLADVELNIKWPIPLDEAIINQRDRNHPNLSNAKRFGSV